MAILGNKYYYKSSDVVLVEPKGDGKPGKASWKKRVAYAEFESINRRHWSQKAKRDNQGEGLHGQRSEGQQ